MDAIGGGARRSCVDLEVEWRVRVGWTGRKGEVVVVEGGGGVSDSDDMVGFMVSPWMGPKIHLVKKNKSRSRRVAERVVLGKKEKG